MKRLSNDILIDFFIFIASIFLLVISSDYPAMARTFPQLILIIVAILCIGDIVYKLLRKDKTEVSQRKEKGNGGKRVYYTVILMFAYLPFILVLGFITGTLIFLIFSTWSFGYKKVKGLLISSICSAGLMYLIFILIMKAFFPEGLLISILRR